MNKLRILGTPGEETWPGVTQMRGFSEWNFPEWKPKDLSQYCPRLDEAGVDLLQVSIFYL